MIFIIAIQINVILINVILVKMILINKILITLTLSFFSWIVSLSPWASELEISFSCVDRNHTWQELEASSNSSCSATIFSRQPTFSLKKIFFHVHGLHASTLSSNHPIK